MPKIVGSRDLGHAQF